MLNISFALDNLARETARREAEAALRHSETRFATSPMLPPNMRGKPTSVAHQLHFRQSRRRSPGYRSRRAHGRRHPRDFMPPGEPERVHTWLKANRRVGRLLPRSGTSGGGALGRNPLGATERRAILNDRRPAHRLARYGRRYHRSQAPPMQRINYLATRDPLTELPNRVLLGDRLPQPSLGARRNTHALALMFVDLDRFKNINDSLGPRDRRSRAEGRGRAPDGLHPQGRYFGSSGRRRVRCAAREICGMRKTRLTSRPRF